MKLLIKILIILAIVNTAYGARLEKIEVYRSAFCNGNKIVTLPDKTRADCFIFKDNLVVDVSWADNWHDGIGRAIAYSIQAKRLPGLALVIENEADCKYVQRAIEAIRNTYLRMFDGSMVRIELRQAGPLRCITGTITR